jgi:acyl-ACP thioesterase
MNKYTKTYNVILDNMDMFRYRHRPIAAIMYLQDAFARFTATKKMAAYDLFDKNLYWVVAEFNMDFVDSLPFWSEELKIELWFSEISKLKIYIDFNLYYKDKVITKGNALWFLIDKETKRPAKTDILKEKFEVCEELVLGEHKKFIVPDSKELYKQITHTNNLSDIDFNNHVNNKSYINLAEMTAPDEFKETHTLKELHIRFNKETFLGDSLTCSTFRTDIPNTYTHKIEKEGVPVCDISTVWRENTNDTKIVDYDLKIKSEH